MHRSGIRRTGLVGCLAGFLLLGAGAVRGQEVVVESEAAAKARTGGGSVFLLPPGMSGYTDPIDWRAVPPSRQTSFYGVRARGTFFVFVVDCSGSMSHEERWLRVQRELRKTLLGLQFPQRYLVIFYNDGIRPMPGGLPQSAERASILRTLAWSGQVVPDGGTEPEPAMRMALGLHPNAVFLLSDGAYPDGAADRIIELNQGAAKVPVHCVDLSGGAAGTDLKRIAERSNGQYAARGTSN
jgi:hypothetical protein